ncbi:hypothetical protein [Arsenophonus endosymbiont of Aleurodicus floccissimus]|uniref:hypothetical protein n=1 Tax=Arsenophonus endosymbiont of Aleurodicus floccissimus TaxID=2152761 RepID=UPI00160088EF|nr:hypothetical protein [Arsenophonus endosymbiont of Aleurodicus floccissimus]
MTELSISEAVNNAKESFSILVTTFIDSANELFKKIEQAIYKAEQGTGAVTGTT